MNIPLPSKPKIVSESGNRAVFEIEGLYPGYGPTIGNSLRRILLSSLRGSVITSVKIEGVGHEFSSVEGVKEDMVELLLNLKQLRFKLHTDEPVTVALSAKGEKELTGKDFKVPSQAELINKIVHVASLTGKKSALNLEAVVESGVGYVPVEARSKEKVEIGTMALDASFSPIRHVNYEVENMRVGDRTDYNRVRLTLETDGSLSPREAVEEAIKILVGQWSALVGGFVESAKAAPAESERSREPVKEKAASEDASKMKVDELRLSSRVINVLREAGVKTVGGLARKKESKLREIGGLGDKGVQEIKKELGKLGMTLKQ